MKDQLDQRIHQLVTEVSDAAPLPPPLENLNMQSPAAAGGSRRLMVAASMVVMLGLVALGAVVVLRDDIDDSPSARVGESSVPSTAPTESTGAPTSAGEGEVGFRIVTDADGVAITEVEIDGQRCLRLDGVEAPATAPPILTCENDVQPAGGARARPGILVPRRAEGTGRLIFVGLHDPRVATIVLRHEEVLEPYRQVIEPRLWAPGEVGVALVALPADLSQNATNFTVELYDNDGTVVSLQSTGVPD